MNHTIRANGVGDTKNVNLTPMRAIRYQCVECMGFKPRLIEGCTSKLCPLYLYRNGKNPQMADRKGNVSALQAKKLAR